MNAKPCKSLKASSNQTEVDGTFESEKTAAKVKKLRVSALSRQEIVLRLVVATPAVALGLLKAYLHFDSIWRYGVLDYAMALGVILGGLLVFARSKSKIALAVSIPLIAVEVFKAASDYKDGFDLLLTLLALLYLSSFLLRFILSRRSIL